MSPEVLQVDERKWAEICSVAIFVADRDSPTHDLNNHDIEATVFTLYHCLGNYLLGTLTKYCEIKLKCKNRE